MRNDNEVYTEERNGYTIRIIHDDDAQNPREWDNVCHMVCWHRRYNLGDEQPNLDPDSWMEENAKDIVAVLPLYLYDHSGITIRCAPFSCPWDSGQVGYAYVTKDKVAKEYPEWKRITKQRKAKLEEMIRAEVACYDDYLTGNCYGYVVEHNGDEIESCCGYLGDYDREGGCLDEARSIVDWHEKNEGIPLLAPLLGVKEAV